jgi:hypothetical protein
MQTRTVILLGGASAFLLLGACGGGGGGSNPQTTFNLAGSYGYVLTAGAMTGNGVADCTADDDASGTATVTWTTGSDQCSLDIEGQVVTANVRGNTITHTKSGADADCDVSYGESWSLTWTSDDAAAGFVKWSCQWTNGGTTYSCAQKDDLTVTRL